MNKKLIAGFWHSNIDVQAVNSLKGGLFYLKKYLLKSIDFQNATSKAKKTLALCWTYRKRAFSVSGKFRNLLHALIKHMHNSNHKTKQLTLEGKVIEEYKYHVLRFVSITILGLEQEVWFLKLNKEQIKILEEFFNACLKNIDCSRTYFLCTRVRDS